MNLEIDPEILSSILKEVEQRKRAIKEGKIKPPWIEYPDYEPYCLGWRMGSGEDYIDDWYGFIKNLDRNKLKKYFDKYNIPKEWKPRLKKYIIIKGE